MDSFHPVNWSAPRTPPPHPPFKEGGGGGGGGGGFVWINDDLAHISLQSNSPNACLPQTY